MARWPTRTATMEGLPVSDLINVFPTILLGAMLVLTLILLPLLNDRPQDETKPLRTAREDRAGDGKRYRQRTEEIRVPVKREH
jgi:hypothetical protein